MTSRVIRDGLLDSEAVAALHDKTYRLYTHLLLAADDFGLVGVGYGPIKRAAPLMDWSREIVAKMLGELTDAGLILPYESGGKQFAAIAKWKSAINCMAPKHPIPTFGMCHVIGAYRFKSAAVREAVLKIAPHIKELTLESGAPVVHQCPASDTKGYGVRGKGEGVRGSTPSQEENSPPQLINSYGGARRADGGSDA